MRSLAADHRIES